MAIAAIIVRDGNFFELTAITGAVDAFEIFQTSNAYSEGIKVKRIEFQAGSNNDSIVIREAATDGATIATLASADVEVVDRVYFEDGGQFMKPHVDFADSTLNAGHKLIFEIE